MSPGTRLKLGTRRSLLAWAQSGWVARELERLNPGVSVELVGIDTRGDKILDVPLTSVEGKEFFVAELDAALRTGAVDLTVHSMKDLSLDRPAQFTLGAIPPRENPRDVVLFAPGTIDRVRAGRPLRIGTSSPRRLENIPSFVARALPQLAPGGAPALEFLEIRGNVNTRLSRVHEPEGSERRLDAVVLAFAGLIRLWNDAAGRAELEKLLRGVRWMVLPLRECPSAPGQGALAVECRADDARVREILGRLHDGETARRTADERQLLADWGGGCHQKFGATAVPAGELGDLLFIRGAKPDGAFVDELRWQNPAPPAAGAGARAWDGSLWRGTISPVDFSADLPRRAAEAAPDLAGKAVFVAHARALPSAWVGQASRARIWVSGTASWFKLAQAGLWVEGCAESLGFDRLRPTLAEGVLGLPPLLEWNALTHEGAAEDWQGARAIATYRVGSDYDEAARATLAGAEYVYWSSGSQFDRLRGQVAARARHCCGPGKTAARLKEAGIEPIVFPSVEEWRKWVRI